MAAPGVLDMPDARPASDVMFDAHAVWSANRGEEVTFWDEWFDAKGLAWPDDHNALIDRNVTTVLVPVADVCRYRRAPNEIIVNVRKYDAFQS
jgi:hypothetical protein